MKKSIILLAVVAATGCTSPVMVKWFGNPSWSDDYNPLWAYNHCVAYATDQVSRGNADGQLWVQYRHGYHSYAYKLHSDGTVTAWDDDGAHRLTEWEMENGNWLGPKPKGIRP